MSRFLLHCFLTLCLLVSTPAANNSIAVSLTRTGTPQAWQAFVANPLDLNLAFATLGETFTGATALRIELHPDRLVSPGRAPLALITQDTPTGATTTATFSGAQLNQDLQGKTSRAFWLVAYATYPSDVMQVFQLGTLTLLAHPASITAPAPPNPVLALTQDQADLLYAPIDGGGGSYQPLDNDLTAVSLLTTTAYGRSVLETANGTALRLLAGCGSLATQSGLIANYALTTDVAAGYQPLNSGLTAIAALTTNPAGRSLLTAEDASEIRGFAGLGTLATQNGTFSGSHSGTSSGTNTGDQDLSSYLTSAAAATTYVPVTRTINGSALSSNITISTITGNAGTATALQTARAINGTNFDGTAAITVTAAAGTLTGTTLNSTVTGSSLTSLGTLSALTTNGLHTYGTSSSWSYGTGMAAAHRTALGLGTADSPSFAGLTLTSGTFSGGINTPNYCIVSYIGGYYARHNSGKYNLGASDDVALGRNAAGVAEINNGTASAYRDIKVRNVIQTPGIGTSVTPAANGDMVLEATSNTSVTLKLKGSDGTVRSIVLTLAP